MAYRIGISGARCYALVLLVFMLLENFFIFPAPQYPDGNWSAKLWKAEDVYFKSDDGTDLHGWYAEHPVPRAVILYCHGNGEHVAYGADRLTMRDRLGVSVFLFDYRGYGRSSGSPREQGVLADGRAAALWLADRAGIEPSELVFMGRSLGGAVAIDLASEYGGRAVIVESTFTSMPDVAARLIRWAPVRWLLRTRFNSIEKIANYRGPLLQSHGTEDELVPLELGRRLFEAAPTSRKEFLEFPGDRHNDPPPSVYWDVLDRFLGELETHSDED
jgi:hypothetical protein